MNSKLLPTLGDKSFESIKQTNEHGAEYWSARDLQLLLGYSQWRRFEQAIERAVSSCRQSGNKPDYHFAGAGKMVDLGSGSQRELVDYHLSRFACYLIAQNGDPRKPEIAQAQKYFAVQARRQELNDQAAADIERLELRKQTAEEFKALSGAPFLRQAQDDRKDKLRANVQAGCSASSTMPATRVCMAVWAVMPSSAARPCPRKTTCSTA